MIISVCYQYIIVCGTRPLLLLLKTATSKILLRSKLFKVVGQESISGRFRLTSLISLSGGISSSSSDSSSELESSSDDVKSVGDEGPLAGAVNLPSSPRILVNLSTGGLAVPLYVLTDTFFSLGGRIFVDDECAGVNIPTRELASVNKRNQN